MARRRYNSMAKPSRSRTTSRGGAAAPRSNASPSRSASSKAAKARHSSTAAKPASSGSVFDRMGRWLLAWVRGPAGQQILALVLIALGSISFIS